MFKNTHIRIKNKNIKTKNKHQFLLFHLVKKMDRALFTNITRSEICANNILYHTKQTTKTFKRVLSTYGTRFVWHSKGPKQSNLIQNTKKHKHPKTYAKQKTTNEKTNINQSSSNHINKISNGSCYPTNCTRPISCICSIINVFKKDESCFCPLMVHVLWYAYKKKTNKVGSCLSN